jgi:hypothetical protein
MQTFTRRLIGTIFALAAIVALAGCVPSADTLREWVGAIGGAPGDGPPAPDASGGPIHQATPTLAPLVAPQSEAPVTHDEAATPAYPAVSATEPAPAIAPGGLFSGTFVGTITGDGGSEAPLRLELSQQGQSVGGTATLGEGLRINAGGFCGRFSVPAATFAASETLPAPDSRQLEASTTFDVEGFEIPLTLKATVAPDGETMAVEATLYTPVLCTNNPTVTGTLTRKP